MGERHTDLGYQRVQVGSAPVVALLPVNRRRALRLSHSFLVPPIWVGLDPQLGPGTGDLVTRFSGDYYPLGPNQTLYAVTVGPWESVLHIRVIDQSDEGQFTDDGTGTV